MMKILAALTVLAFTGCTMPNGSVEPANEAPKDPIMVGACDATQLQYAIGQKSSAALGTKLMQESGAKTLRWMPPRTAATMDFRSDRLNIAYDDSMVITAIDCG